MWVSSRVEFKMDDMGGFGAPKCSKLVFLDFEFF